MNLTEKATSTNSFELEVKAYDKLEVSKVGVAAEETTGANRKIELEVPNKAVCLLVAGSNK